MWLCTCVHHALHLNWQTTYTCTLFICYLVKSMFVSKFRTEPFPHFRMIRFSTNMEWGINPIRCTPRCCGCSLADWQAEWPFNDSTVSSILIVAQIVPLTSTISHVSKIPSISIQCDTTLPCTAIYFVCCTFLGRARMLRKSFRESRLLMRLVNVSACSLTVLAFFVLWTKFVVCF